MKYNYDHNLPNTAIHNLRCNARNIQHIKNESLSKKENIHGGLKVSTAQRFVIELSILGVIEACPI